MGKRLFIAEKPSVAREFGNALKEKMSSHDGYIESTQTVVTWCIGHLVTMSYPDAYDPKYKRWSFDTIPFLPTLYKYELIETVKKQFVIVSNLLNRPDVDVIYVCTDSGREGEYIYRLVEQMSGAQGKQRKRVWIDSQTEEEILRGIQEAKDLSAYDHLADAAYLRAKEDYLMGINFSRVLTLKYGNSVKDYLKRDKAVISVGRVMTCVLGMVVSREREIRSFEKTPFYRISASFFFTPPNRKEDDTLECIEAEWKSMEGSKYWESPFLYKENGFRTKAAAEELIEHLRNDSLPPMKLEQIERKKETKNPPLLYNLAELQNDCSKYFKISPDETLQIVQELYEKKMVTYPRTDARVLSTAVAKEIHKNLSGLQHHPHLGEIANKIIEEQAQKQIQKSRYVDDKQITDHYAIIPTGHDAKSIARLSERAANVYDLIARRFLCIFLPPAQYRKITLVIAIPWKQEEVLYTERFTSGFKFLTQMGYLTAAPFVSTQDNEAQKEKMALFEQLKKGQVFSSASYEIKEGETTPPKRYSSGSMILAMENAGQLIEDDDLRAQIKGSGIGTSATRAEILKKLVTIEYLKLNKKTQFLTPTLMGEMIYDVVNASLRPLLDPALTASWEKGLTMVAGGEITAEEYQKKLNDFVARRTNYVKRLNNQKDLYTGFCQTSKYY
ncbi:MAG: type IA DNA topoisomerase [Lachnospiraceae bacterium]|nr:type IA DNA topoisomerase [Lachnospiraceae bacterium]